MKKLLIIYTDWMPSNVVGAQRARLIANYTSDFGWQTHILSVDPKFYVSTSEELNKLVKPNVITTFVGLDKRSKYMKGIGDLTLLAYKNLKNAALDIIKREKIDFIWYPIPSYYNALLAPPIFKATGVKFGIDYIDPWVNGFPGQNKIFSKAWLANQLAKILEPYSVKKASLISGVAFHYYSPVLERNFSIPNVPNKYSVVNVAMQYGFDPYDYTIELDNFQLPWSTEIKAIVYAGAFLPKSHLFIELLFKEIGKLKAIGKLDTSIRFYFFGTGSYKEKSILDYAKEAGISELVFEKRDRISYLQILQILKQAYGVMVIGSTEKHYTASKVFQSLLSGTPVFSIFHKESDAAKILTEVGADNLLVQYTNEGIEENLIKDIGEKFSLFCDPEKAWSLNLTKLEPYSACESARLLIDGIEKCLS